jgi:hypothetical protein
MRYIKGVAVDRLYLVTVKHRGMAHVLVRIGGRDFDAHAGAIIFLPEALHFVKALTYDCFCQWIEIGDILDVLFKPPTI